MREDQLAFKKDEGAEGVFTVTADAAEAQVLKGFLGENREAVMKKLRSTGAILLRGFEVGDASGLQAGMAALGQELLGYSERSSPRTQVSGRVYTSTDYPAHQRIFLHNENSYASTWPQWIAFCALVPAEVGGETPIAAIEKVAQRISPEVLDEFARKGIRYIRNYRPGIGMSWQEGFQTEDQDLVNERCSERGMRASWDGEELHTEWEATAWQLNDVTERDVWFNHATFFHITTLPDEVGEGLRAIFSDEELPTNTMFGDGSPIPDETVDHLRRAYEAEEVTFPWQAGDVLILDNMRFAHARRPFEGQRKVVVCMSEPVSRRTVAER